MKAQHPLTLTLTLLSLLALALAVPALAAPSAQAPATPTITGDYMEARTSDVYTGSCFANSEVNLTGREAVLAWHVRAGAWAGVPVDGLAVVAAVHASATLGDPTRNPLPAHAVLVVDQRATPAQKDALVGFAHAMAGDLLGDVVAVYSAPVDFEVGAAASDGQEHLGRNHSALPSAHHSHFEGGAAKLTAGTLIELQTRPLNHGDHLCGNEEIYYPPLTAAHDAVPAVTLANAYRGNDLGLTWSSPEKRSAFVGTFAR
ncbi:MAG TPA: DUF1326 domain-containing protein [Thermoanaerobaculia bacterium]